MVVGEVEVHVRILAFTGSSRVPRGGVRKSPAMTLSRRQFLRTGAVAGAAVVAFPGRAPRSSARGRSLTHGIQSGDVTAGSGSCGRARTGRAGCSSQLGDPRPPRRPRWIDGPCCTERTDFTGKLELDWLPPGREIDYRVALEDLRRPRPCAASRWPARSARRRCDRRDVSFVWSGDLAGQGWGINPDLGGYRIFEAMEALEPDFFLCSGDTIYADGPLRRAVTLPDGRIWRNIVTPGEDQGRRDARRVPRPVRATTCSTRTCAAFDARGPADQPVGRPRGAQQLVPGRDPGRRPLHREERRRARRARAAGVLRVLPDRARRGRIYRQRSRTARCSTSSSSTCGPTRTRTTPTVYADPHARAARRRAARVAQARARGVHGDLEGRSRPTSRSASSCRTAQPRGPSPRRDLGRDGAVHPAAYGVSQEGAGAAHGVRAHSAASCTTTADAVAMSCTDAHSRTRVELVAAGEQVRRRQAGGAQQTAVGAAADRLAHRLEALGADRALGDARRPAARARGSAAGSGTGARPRPRGARRGAAATTSSAVRRSSATCCSSLSSSKSRTIASITALPAEPRTS